MSMSTNLTPAKAAELLARVRSLSIGARTAQPAPVVGNKVKFNAPDLPPAAAAVDDDLDGSTQLFYPIKTPYYLNGRIVSGLLYNAPDLPPSAEDSVIVDPSLYLPQEG